MAIAEDPKSTQVAEILKSAPVTDVLSTSERRLLSDLFAIVSEHAADSSVEIDRGRVQDAFVFACEHHAAQRRKSGEDFIVHPVGVARICAGMRLDTETLCAALLHDTVEDTSASIEEVRERFGEEIAGVVDGVTKLTGITFQSHDEAQANNYRKMMVAMATDVRVILIKLADRLHNMRTIDAMPKQKQMEKARETLEIYAPLAHRLGIHAIKWELEDLAFATLHPRKYQEIKGLVAQQREERERYVSEAGEYLRGRAGRGGHPGPDRRSRQALLLDLLEDDQEGPRVQRDLRPHRDARDRRLGEGLLRDRRRDPLAVEAAARPLQGLHRDAQVQHVPVAAHDRHRARGPAAGDPDPHPRDARDGGVRGGRPLGLQAAAPAGQRRPGEDAKLKWLRSMLDWQKDLLGPAGVHGDAAHRPVRGGGVRLHAQGRSQVAGGRRHAAGLRLRGAHRDRPPLRGRARQRQDRAAALRAALRRHRRDPHRQARARAFARLAGDGQDDTRAQQDQGVVQGRVPPGHRAHRARVAAGAPAQTGSARAEDHRLGAAGGRDPRGRLPQGRRLLHRAGRPPRSRRSSSSAR